MAVPPGSSNTSRGAAGNRRWGPLGAILPYLFTDISRTDKVPVTYQIDLSNGFSFAKGDKVYQYKGWRELLSEILVYEANEAKVPNYITTEGPNDLLEVLAR